MKKVFSALIVGVIGISLSACAVSVCPRTVKHCHTECDSTCYDPYAGTWYPCDCFDVCTTECPDTPDGGK